MSIVGRVSRSLIAALLVALAICWTIVACGAEASATDAIAGRGCPLESAATKRGRLHREQRSVYFGRF